MDPTDPDPLHCFAHHITMGNIKLPVCEIKKNKKIKGFQKGEFGSVPIIYRFKTLRIISYQRSADPLSLGLSGS
jgi:hypothetical protein